MTMVGYSEYQGYVVDFERREFQRLDKDNVIVRAVPFDTNLGFEMLIGFVQQLLVEKWEVRNI
jgi:hypothetical protein